MWEHTICEKHCLCSVHFNLVLEIYLSTSSWNYKMELIDHHCVLKLIQKTKTISLQKVQNLMYYLP